MNYNEQCIKNYFDYVYHFEIKDKEMIDCFIEILNDLTERELAVITYRHGLIDGEAKGLEAVASHFGVDAQSIKDIDIQVIKKLRHPNRSKYFSMDNANNEEVNGVKMFKVHKDYLPQGTIIQDIIEKKENK
jgi:hypothetical protein